MSIFTIKAGIKAKLDTLVTSAVLGVAVSSDIRKDPLQTDAGAYPQAILMPPAIESEVLDNRTIIRTYSFDVMVLFNAENIAGTADVETAVETMLSAFDNDPTLGGTALGGMLPISSSPEPFQHGGKDLIMVVLQIKAKDVVSLTFA